MTPARFMQPSPSNGRPEWVLWFVVLGLSFASIIYLRHLHFTFSLYIITLLTLISVYFALCRRPFTPAQSVVYLQIVLLTLLYIYKGLYIAALMNSSNDGYLPNNLRNGLSQDTFFIAYWSSSALILTLAGVYILLVKSQKEMGKDIVHTQGGYSRKGKMLLITFSIVFFAVSILLRATPIDGILGSLVYVANHRTAHYIFALLLPFLVSTNNLALARAALLAWLALSVFQFGLFASKSYLFYPLITTLLIYIFNGVVILPRLLMAFILVGVVSIYPVLNLYRSMLAGGSIGSLDLVNAFELLTYARNSQSLFDVLPVYFYQMIGRFVGIEWYLVVMQSVESRFVTPSTGAIGNLLSTQDTMRDIAGFSGRLIGIAPSLLGACLLVTRDVFLAILFALFFGLLLVCIQKAFELTFTRLNHIMAFPFSLIVYSTFTDGLLVSLYWDVPALAAACLFFGGMVRRITPKLVGSPV